MRQKSERSLVFLFVCLVFFGLLLSGGSRLIGTQRMERDLPERPAAPVRAAFTRAPAPAPETGRVQQDEQAAQRMDAAPAPQSGGAHRAVLCDANGNVLQERNYLHAVYQAFALGDGFV